MSRQVGADNVIIVLASVGTPGLVVMLLLLLTPDMCTQLYPAVPSVRLLSADCIQILPSQ